MPSIKQEGAAGGLAARIRIAQLPAQAAIIVSMKKARKRDSLGFDFVF
jgi:hypothetical protein